jgi:hypothetical protein
MSDPLPRLVCMVGRADVIEAWDLGSPLSATEPLTLPELLDFAEALPADGTLVDFLLSLRTERFDQAGQVRLAQLWARVESAAAGHKLEAVGAVEVAGPTSDDLLDMRDAEIAPALNVGMTTARNLMAVGSTLFAKGRGVLEVLKEGELRYGHVLQYADALVGLSPEQCTRLEELTLEKARTRTPGQLRRLLRRAVARIGGEDFARRHKAATKDTHLSVFFDEPDGTATLSARMSAIDAAIVDKAVEAWARAAKAGGDSRSLRELRTAAVVDMAEGYLRGPDAPRTHGRPVMVNARSTCRPSSVSPTTRARSSVSARWSLRRPFAISSR